MEIQKFKQTVYLPVSELHSSEKAVCTIGIPDLYGDKVVYAFCENLKSDRHGHPLTLKSKACNNLEL